MYTYICTYKPIYLHTNTYVHISLYTLTTSYNRAGMQHGSLKLPAHAVREHSIICIHKAQIHPRTLRDRLITRPPRTPRRRVGVGARAFGPSVAVAHTLDTGILQLLGPCTDAGLRAVRGRVVKDRDFERPCVVLRCARRQALLQPWHGVVARDDYRHQRPGRSRRGPRGHTAVRLCQRHRTLTQAQAERASCPRHWLHRKEQKKRHEDRREDAAEATGWRATGQCYGARALGPVRMMVNLVALACVGWGWAPTFLARASLATMLHLLRVRALHEMHSRGFGGAVAKDTAGAPLLPRPHRHNYAAACHSIHPRPMRHSTPAQPGAAGAQTAHR